MITRANIQTLGVFPLPELFAEDCKRRFGINFLKLQQRLMSGKDKKIKGLQLVPAFNFYQTGAYTERYWGLFQFPGEKDFPRHFPFRIIGFDVPEYRPDVDPAILDYYSLRVKGFLFPYGAACLRIIETIAPSRPITADELMDIAREKLISGGQKKSRKGILGDLKEDVFKGIIRANNFPHDTYRYRTVFIKTDKKIEQNKDWDQLSVLLAFHPDNRITSKYLPTDYQNLGFKDQIILAGHKAGVMYTPDLWDSPNGCRCLQNRFANTAELAIIQRQLFGSYEREIHQANLNLQKVEGRGLPEISLTVKPYITYREIQILNSIMTFHDAFSSHTRYKEVIQWNKWYNTISGHVFNARDKARQEIDLFNQLHKGIANNAVGNVNGIIKALQPFIP